MRSSLRRTKSSLSKSNSGLASSASRRRSSILAASWAARLAVCFSFFSAAVTTAAACFSSSSGPPQEFLAARIAIAKGGDKVFDASLQGLEIDRIKRLSDTGGRRKSRQEAKRKNNQQSPPERSRKRGHGIEPFPGHEEPSRSHLPSGTIGVVFPSHATIRARICIRKPTTGTQSTARARPDDRASGRFLLRREECGVGRSGNQACGPNSLTPNNQCNMRLGELQGILSAPFSRQVAFLAGCTE